MEPSVSPGAADQARVELSVAASNAERANRPRWMLVIASLVLAGATIYALTGLSARAEALRRVSVERDKTRDVLVLAERHRALTDLAATRGFEKDPNLAADLEGLIRGIGLTINGNVSDSESGGQTVPGMVEKQYKIRFNNQDPRLLLQFLASAMSSSEMVGLEIYSLNITPSGQPLEGSEEIGWNLEVTFSRWERR